ncbi:MAG: hypothetical protein ACK5Q5_18080 [Planctomycetaceae bacterium]
MPTLRRDEGMAPGRWYDPNSGRFLDATGPAQSSRPLPPMNSVQGIDTRCNVKLSWLDSFSGAVANGLMFGRGESVYGEGMNQKFYEQHSSAWWTGTGATIAGQVVLGFLTGGATAAGTVGGISSGMLLLARGYQAYAVAGDLVGMYDSYQAVVSDNFRATDLLGFAPSLGWAMGAARGAKGLGIGYAYAAYGASGSRRAVTKATLLRRLSELQTTSTSREVFDAIASNKVTLRVTRVAQAKRGMFNGRELVIDGTRGLDVALTTLVHEGRHAIDVLAGVIPSPLNGRISASARLFAEARAWGAELAFASRNGIRHTAIDGLLGLHPREAVLDIASTYRLSGSLSTSLLWSVSDDDLLRSITAFSDFRY